ncbi:unnamed protein product [Lymnaea stagnalis]|uniref:RWD domain-containing protein n=1 Tax=Lymnaea stagnalis TaxID=6523 RepID=A0AAV2HSR4_LYMST
MTEDSTRLRQADEIQALSSIYGEDWCVLDSSTHRYAVRITDSAETPKWKVTLQVHMPEGYPQNSPPEYQISAPWLRGEERNRLEDALAQVYCDNLGEDIVYLWVEAVREFLQQKTDQAEVKPAVDLQDDLDPTAEDLETSFVFSFRHFELSRIFNFKKFRHFFPFNTVECPDIIHGETILDRKSTFQPHLAIVRDKDQVSAVMNKLMENKKIANATHNMLAYRIIGDSGVVYQGCHDDGETHAGSRMLHLLQIMKVENVLVVVSRWYGGIQLGPDRFKHINNCCRQILEANGFLSEKVINMCNFDFEQLQILSSCNTDNL